MRLFAAIFLLLAAAQPAAAATTVYAASVFGTGGTVFAPGNAIGAANGTSATIFRLFGASTLTLQMSEAITGGTTTLSGQRLTAGSNVQIAIGEVIGGIATFSANLALPGGLGTLHTLDLTALCATVSATGCSLLRIRVAGPLGSGFTLDGVSGVAAAPEPSAWALMIVGFGAVAWRLRRQRAQQPALARIKT